MKDIQAKVICDSKQLLGLADLDLYQKSSSVDKTNVLPYLGLFSIC